MQTIISHHTNRFGQSSGRMLAVFAAATILVSAVSATQSSSMVVHEPAIAATQCDQILSGMQPSSWPVNKAGRVAYCNADGQMIIIRAAPQQTSKPNRQRPPVGASYPLSTLSGALQ